MIVVNATSAAQINPDAHFTVTVDSDFTVAHVDGGYAGAKLRASALVQ